MGTVPRNYGGQSLWFSPELVFLDVFVSLNEHRNRRRRNCVVLAIVIVVVAVIVVAIPIVVDAVHDDHPLLLDPFPRTKRTDPPHWNDRPRPVVRARMAWNVVASETGRRRMVAWLWTDVSVPCEARLIDMMGRCSMLRRSWLGYGSRELRSARPLGDAWFGCGSCELGSACPRGGAWSGCRSRKLRSPHLLGRSCRTSVAAARSAFRCSERRCAECRAGDSDECEFHEVVVHSTPSLSVGDLTGSSSRPYNKQGVHATRF